MKALNKEYFSYSAMGAILETISSLQMINIYRRTSLHNYKQIIMSYIDAERAKIK